jgi:mitotic spindle assembly checkpoint protein MAD2
MKDGKISKLVMAIVSKDTGEVLERWQFDVHIFGKHSPSPAQSSRRTDHLEKENQGSHYPDTHNIFLTNRNSHDEPKVEKEKTEAEIHSEIQAIIRQITASVTFLPMLEGRCTFNVLVYADADANVPDEEWGDSDAKDVKNAENVKLRSFSTMNHRIDTMVSYRLDADEY